LVSERVHDSFSVVRQAFRVAADSFWVSVLVPVVGVSGKWEVTVAEGGVSPDFKRLCSAFFVSLGGIGVYGERRLNNTSES
jgi:hypothetical protein